jgi:hypothetical protein
MLMARPMTTMPCGYLRSYVSVFNWQDYFRTFLHASLWVVLLLVCACKDNGKPDVATSFNAPFNLTSHQSSADAASMMKSCPPAPSKPIKDLVLNSVYKRTDPTRSEIDEDSRELYQAQTKSLNVFQDKLSKSSNAYLKSNGQDSASICALNWLYEWAQNGALLGENECSRNVFSAMGAGGLFIFLSSDPK